VFPCEPRGKKPLCEHGLKDASTNEETIRTWWARSPDANIGHPTGQHIVLDVDGPEGEAALAELEAEHGKLPVTRTAQTGKGKHLYFSADGSKLRNSVSKLGPHLDIRGEGGYVIVPPSVHQNGKRYEWVDPQIKSAPLPAWVAALLAEQARTKADTDNTDEKITEPHRHPFLMSLAGTLRGKGMDEATIRAALLAVNRAKCGPPKPDDEVREIARAAGGYPPAAANWTAANPWDSAAFVTEDEEQASTEFLQPPVLAPGHLTEIAGPRGLGKSNYALWLAVKLARAGKRVLYLDRDNPPRKTRQNVRAWGGARIVKLLTRDKIPALLGNEAEWKAFPTESYDLVILDSWDSTAEGVGEKDSRLPSIAISRILDIVHAESGPGVLVLMNTVRDGTHSRCSGIVEDRADAVFEVRDLTGVQFQGQKPWHEEMPVVGARDWATRATRRKDKERLRLGFVASKYKIDGPEPSPFAAEIDFTTSPYSIRDITDEIDAEGAATREQRAREKAESIEKSVAALVAEISRRAQVGEAALLKKEAEEFLTHLAGVRITQIEARKITESKTFELVPEGGKGHAKAVHLAGKKNESNRNRRPTEPAQTQAGNGADFGCSQSMHPTEIDPFQTSTNSGSEMPGISVEASLFTSPPGAENEPLDEEVL
jgi:hypothetical protein